MNPSALPTGQTYNGYTPYTPYNQQGVSAINSAQSGIQGLTPQPTQGAPIADAPTHGNWLTHLLPTAGSILGGLVGLPLNALDAVSGIGGTAADIGLAGAGSAGGKALENFLEGTPDTAKGLLTSAGEGALGQGIGEGIGAIGGAALGKGANALNSAVEGRATQAATDAAAQDAATEATRVGNEFAAVKPGAAQVGPALDKLTSLGITSPTAQDAVNIGSTYTGSNPETGTGVLNFYKQQALDQAGGKVNLGNTMDTLHTTLSSPENQAELGSEEPVTTGRGLPKAPTNPATKIIQQVRNMLPDGTINTQGQIAQTVNPQEGFQLLKSIGDQITQTTPKANALGVLNPAEVAENNVWKSVYGNVKSALYNRPEVDAAVQGLKVGPDESAVIDDAIRSNGITDPQVAANVKADLTGTLNNSQTAQDLLDQERPMVNVSRVGSIAHNDQVNNPQLPRNVRGTKASLETPPAQESGGKLPGLLAAGGLAAAPVTGGASLLATLPEAAKIVKNPETQAMANKLVQSGVSKRIAKVLPSVLTGASQFITHAPDSQPSPVNLNLGSNDMNPNPQQPVDPNSLNNLLMRLAVAESANPSTSGSGAGIIGQILPQVQSANVAQNSLTGAENAFQQAGGGQGGILGNLSKILGGITGNPASQYEQQRTQLINQLTPLGIPTSAVPDITGNNQSAQNQFQTLQDMIRARLQGGSVLGGLQ